MTWRGWALLAAGAGTWALAYYLAPPPAPLSPQATDAEIAVANRVAVPPAFRPYPDGGAAD